MQNSARIKLMLLRVIDEDGTWRLPFVDSTVRDPVTNDIYPWSDELLAVLGSLYLRHMVERVSDLPSDENTFCLTSRGKEYLKSLESLPEKQLFLVRGTMSVNIYVRASDWRSAKRFAEGNLAQVLEDINIGAENAPYFDIDSDVIHVAGDSQYAPQEDEDVYETEE